MGRAGVTLLDVEKAAILSVITLFDAQFVTIING
jgi:hypothetical protein